LQDVIVVLEGAPLLILMADDSIVELIATHDVRKSAYSLAPEDHDFDTDKYTVRAAANIEYALPPEAIAALKSQNATDLRITAANRSFDIEVNKKSFEDFQNAFACMDL
jgi:hypothetical protein